MWTVAILPQKPKVRGAPRSSPRQKEHVALTKVVGQSRPVHHGGWRYDRLASKSWSIRCAVALLVQRSKIAQCAQVVSPSGRGRRALHSDVGGPNVATLMTGMPSACVDNGCRSATGAKNQKCSKRPGCQLIGKRPSSCPKWYGRLLRSPTDVGDIMGLRRQGQKTVTLLYNLGLQHVASTCPNLIRRHVECHVLNLSRNTLAPTPIR